ncbi:MAG: carboxypeptidase regulatory-like domain-containing protein [Planctomycetes bacterium]|nr:carboxypeptidase regulatory-like domain-containing protein [Planctomycetota bacterium]
MSLLILTGFYLGLAAALPQEPAPSPAPQETKAAAAAKLGVQVRDFETEEPLSGVEIVLEDLPGVPGWRGRTDERGRIEVEQFASGTKLQIVARLGGYAARRVSTVVTGAEDLQRVYLMRAATVSLKLPARPAQDGVGRALRLEPRAGSDTRLLLQDESYLLPVAEDGTVGPVSICIGSYVATLREGGIDRCEWNLEADAATQTAPTELPFESGIASIDGRVLDENGQPRPGARVRLVSESSSGARPIAFADELGLFAFRGVPSGSYRVQVMRRVARNFLDAQDLIMHSRAFDAFQASRRVEVDAETPHVEVRFGYDPRAVNVTGILLSEDIPVPGWRVMLEDRTTGDTWLSEFSRTDGMFDVAGLRPNAKLMISYETSTAWVPGGEMEVGNDEREVHTLRIPPFLFSGQVFYTGTRLSPDEGRLLVEGGGEGENLRWLAWLGPDGTFEVPGLRPGRYEIYVQTPRCKELRRRLVVDADGLRQIDVELEMQLLQTRD